VVLLKTASLRDILAKVDSKITEFERRIYPNRIRDKFDIWWVRIKRISHIGLVMVWVTWKSTLMWWATTCQHCIVISSAFIAYDCRWSSHTARAQVSLKASCCLSVNCSISSSYRSAVAACHSIISQCIQFFSLSPAIWTIIACLNLRRSVVNYLFKFG
jgi:hypothetical protein